MQSLEKAVDVNDKWPTSPKGSSSCIASCCTPLSTSVTLAMRDLGSFDFAASKAPSTKLPMAPVTSSAMSFSFAAADFSSFLGDLEISVALHTNTTWWVMMGEREVRICQDPFFNDPRYPRFSKNPTHDELLAVLKMTEKRSKAVARPLVDRWHYMMLQYVTCHFNHPETFRKASSIGPFNVLESSSTGSMAMDCTNAATVGLGSVLS